MIYVHADDAGLCSTVSDTLLDQLSKGHLNSVSLLVNGLDAGRCADKLREMKEVRTRLHFNLSDGLPVSEPSSVPLLLNEKGALFQDFISLWLTYMTSNRRKKKALREQVERELVAQVVRFKELLNCEQIHFDGHNHIHFIPFVFEAVLKNAKVLGVAEIRSPIEPPLRKIIAPSQMLRVLSSNTLKHALLRWLNARHRYRERIVDAGIETNHFFLGLLDSGAMTAKNIELFFRKNRMGSDDHIEVLFHSGRAAKGELESFLGNSFSSSHHKRVQFFTSYERDKESIELAHFAESPRGNATSN